MAGVVVVADRDWRVIRSVLPDGWRETARQFFAIRRRRGPLSDPDVLLRMLLGLAAGNHPLRYTARHARATGLAAVSHVALFKRLRNSAPWIESIIQTMLVETLAALPRNVLRLRLLDATCVSRPGSKGTDFRLHVIVGLPECTIHDAELTDAEGGESFTRFAVQPGDVMVGDRCYGTARGVAHVHARGGYTLVRINGTSLTLNSGEGARIDPLKFARKLRPGACSEVAVQVRQTKEGAIEGRLCIYALTKEQAEVSQRRVRQTKGKKQKRAGRRAIENAKYVFVFTSLSRSVATATQVLALYRLRWQIELAFKILKSVCGISELPHRRYAPGRAWLLAKLLCGLIAERLASRSRAFPPGEAPAAAA